MVTGITIDTIEKKEVWEKFNHNKSPSNILQSWNWGQFQLSLGRPIKYLGIFNTKGNNQNTLLDPKNLVGICLAHQTPTKLRNHIYVPNGPILNWEHAVDILPILIEELKKFAEETNVIFIRIQPLILNTKEHRKILRRHGFQKSSIPIQPPKKWILDITKDNKDLLNNMTEHTRFAIKRSAKQGVKIESSIDFKKLDKFWELFKQNIKKDHIIPHPKYYYEEQIKAFAQDRQYRIYWATHKNKLLAAALIPFYGDTAYYLHDAFRDHDNSVFASHGLIWQAIQDAKDEEIKYFDFSGISEKKNSHNLWYKSTEFKKGFGGFVQNTISTYDLPIKNTKYSLVKTLESTQKIWRKPYYQIIKRFS
jgi:lipid II:glycine glycyltransferase (peptidoglycan interpeptide bridge formation enzyme)